MCSPTSNECSTNEVWAGASMACSTSKGRHPGASRCLPGSMSMTVATAGGYVRAPKNESDTRQSPLTGKTSMRTRTHVPFKRYDVSVRALNGRLALPRTRIAEDSNGRCAHAAVSLTTHLKHRHPHTRGIAALTAWSVPRPETRLVHRDGVVRLGLGERLATRCWQVTKRQ